MTSETKLSPLDRIDAMTTREAIVFLARGEFETDQYDVSMWTAWLESKIKSDLGTKCYYAVESSVGKNNKRKVCKRFDVLGKAISYAGNFANCIVVTDAAINDGDTWVWGDVRHTIVLPTGETAAYPA